MSAPIDVPHTPRKADGSASQTAAADATAHGRVRRAATGGRTLVGSGRIARVGSWKWPGCDAVAAAVSHHTADEAATTWQPAADPVA
jgi:hypothetical protein